MLILFDFSYQRQICRSLSIDSFIWWTNMLSSQRCCLLLKMIILQRSLWIWASLLIFLDTITIFTMLRNGWCAFIQSCRLCLYYLLNIILSWCLCYYWSIFIKRIILVWWLCQRLSFILKDSCISLAILIKLLNYNLIIIQIGINFIEIFVVIFQFLKSIQQKYLFILKLLLHVHFYLILLRLLIIYQFSF